MPADKNGVRLQAGDIVTLRMRVVRCSELGDPPGCVGVEPLNAMFPGRIETRPASDLELAGRLAGPQFDPLPIHRIEAAEPSDSAIAGRIQPPGDEPPAA